MIEPQCYNCKYFNEKPPKKHGNIILGPNSECRLHPPTVMLDVEGDDVTAWPKVELTDWCAEWSKKDGE